MTSVREIKDRLLRVIDKDGNVLNHSAVMDIILMLEKINITRDELEETRIGKYINDVRRAATDESLQRRAKKLIKTWQQMISMQSVRRTSQTSSSSPSLKRLPTAAVAHDSLNNKRVASPSPNINGGDKLSSVASKKKSGGANLKDNNKKETKVKNNSKSRQSLPKVASAPALGELKSSFTIKPINGLKMTITTKPSPSSSSQKVKLSTVHEEKERLKRKRKDSPQSSPQTTNRTSKTAFQSSPKARTVKNEIDDKPSKSISKSDKKVYNYSSPYRTERKTASPVVVQKPISPKILEPDKTTATPTDVLLKDRNLGNAILSSTFSSNIGTEAAGVDGCRTNDGLWHTWVDSFLLERSQSDPTLPTNAENPDEPDVLSIFPYVELD